MKNKEIYSNYIQLLTLKENKKLRFPAKVSFAIIYNIKTFFPIVETYEWTKDEIINQYAVKDEIHPGYYHIKEGNQNKVQQELTDLDNLETEISIQRIKIQDIENLELSIQDMEALYFMLEE